MNYIGEILSNRNKEAKIYDSRVPLITKGGGK